MVTESSSSARREAGRLSMAYGLVFGQNERKAIAMSILDGALMQQGDRLAVNDAEFVLYHIDGIDFHWYPNWQTVSDSVALAKISQLGVFSANLKSWLSATTAKADVPVFLTEYNIGIGSPNSPVSLNQLVNGLWVANSLGEFIRYFGNGGGTNL